MNIYFSLCILMKNVKKNEGIKEYNEGIKGILMTRKDEKVKLIGLMLMDFTF